MSKSTPTDPPAAALPLHLAPTAGPDRLLTCDLRHVPVLIVDCQTTGSTAGRHQPLELAWCVTAAAHDSGGGTRSTDADVTSHLLRLPDGSRMTRGISKLTGITRSDLDAAVDPAVAWSSLRETAASIAQLEPLDAGVDGSESSDDVPSRTPVLTVAHYARFEQAFLRHLHAQCAPAAPFPLRFICTHEIARRCFPKLPRRGLRALAGYFGFSLPELKRAEPHVRATTVVWNGLVHLLRSGRGIETLGELLELLDRKPPPRKGGWSYPLPRHTRLAITDRPGVYRFLNGCGNVVYVGKAVSLRNRVNSYYRQRQPGDKSLELVSQVRDVEVTPTPSYLEAALLEVDEIQRLDPPYNRVLRSRGNGVWFGSRDLRTTSHRADDGHPLGPLPNRMVLEGLRTLLALLPAEKGEGEANRPHEKPVPSHPTNPARTAARLGLDPRRLRIDVLATGLELFRSKHTDRLRCSRLAEALSLGAALWPARSGNDNDGQDDGRTDELLTSEDVVSHLEDLTVQACRLLRRARWLVLLVDSAVCWQLRGHRRGARRCIAFTDGVAGEPRLLEPGQDPPRPPTPPRSRRQRLAALDRGTYDRLRVLTTEIRRLVTEGRDVEITLATHRRLATPQLLRLMDKI